MAVSVPGYAPRLFEALFLPSGYDVLLTRHRVPEERSAFGELTSKKVSRIQRSIRRKTIWVWSNSVFFHFRNLFKSKSITMKRIEYRTNSGNSSYCRLG